jgi:hypothetical protein
LGILELQDAALEGLGRADLDTGTVAAADQVAGRAAPGLDGDGIAADTASAGLVEVDGGGAPVECVSNIVVGSCRGVCPLLDSLVVNVDGS